MKPSGIVLHPTAQALLNEYVQQPNHALLLAGPLGIGKTALARELAATLLGVSDKSLQNQPYYRSLAPVKNATAIEEVRSLIQFFRLKVPGNAVVKRVAVIEDAEAMSREAQNALLKLLEEPPEGSVLILTSSRPEQLLQTVRSRTQISMIPAPETAQLREHFISAKHDVAAVNRALLRAGTNVAEATRLLGGESGADDSLNLVKQVLGGSTFDRMLLVDGLAKQKDQAIVFVGTLAATAMASLQASATKNTAALPRWQAILAAAHTAEDALNRSGNAKLVLTELMLAL